MRDKREMHHSTPLLPITPSPQPGQSLGIIFFGRFFGIVHQTEGKYLRNIQFNKKTVYFVQLIYQN